MSLSHEDGGGFTDDMEGGVLGEETAAGLRGEAVVEGHGWLSRGPNSCVSLSHEEGGGFTADEMEEGVLERETAAGCRGEGVVATFDASDNKEVDASRVMSGSECTTREGDEGGRGLGALRCRKNANTVCALGVWIVGRLRSTKVRGLVFVVVPGIVQ